MTRGKTREIAVFAMLGALMFGSKKIMEFVPNIHPLAMLTMVYTLAYRWKGLVPVLVYLVLDTVVAGGITWVVPYWYIFPLIWLPRTNMFPPMIQKSQKFPTRSTIHILSSTISRTESEATEKWWICCLHTAAPYDILTM